MDKHEVDCLLHVTQEYKLHKLYDESVSTRNTLRSDAHENNSNAKEAAEVDEQLSRMSGIEIVENLYSLEHRLYQLVELDLSYCQLADLPESLNVLKNLEYLDIEHNNFHSLPNAVCELSKLKKLHASNNRIKHVPRNLGNLSELEALNLDENRLTNLPNSYAALNRLKVCSLCKNAFKKIPHCIAKGMESLQTLCFDRNPCLEMNVYPKSTELICFSGVENDICPSFPTWILCPKYRKLQAVYLNNTRFGTFNISKESLISFVKTLSAKKIRMEIAEAIIAGMSSFEYPAIENCRANGSALDCFWNMPIHENERPSNLDRLYLISVGPAMGPKIVNEFTNLYEIDITSNSVCFLPEEICSLKTLNTLIIDQNNLNNLPENIGEMTRLQQLKVQCNRLYRLPESMKLLNNLEYLDLYDNELKTIPEILWDLPSLIGLNLEQNYFSTEYLRYFRCPNYENMRKNMENIWHSVPPDNEILHGCKSRRHMGYKSRLSSSSSSSSSNLSKESQYVCSLLPEQYNKLLNEHWDTSEDSADEFDPNEYKEPKKRLYPPFTFYKPFQRIYCPAEAHPERVITRIKRMLANGSLVVYSSNYINGQFDDL